MVDFEEELRTKEDKILEGVVTDGLIEVGVMRLTSDFSLAGLSGSCSTSKK